MFSKVGQKQKLTKVILINFLGVVVLAVALAGAFPYAVFASPVTVERLIELTNEARASRGLADLAVDPLLSHSAQMKSNDMLERSYFAHVSPGGLNSWYWFDLVGYRYVYAGENLAADFESSEGLFAAWMDSPTHRANILSPTFKDIGIATASDERGILVTQHFGTRMVLVAGEINSPKTSDSKTYNWPLSPIFLVTLLVVGALASYIWAVRHLFSQTPGHNPDTL